MIQNVASFISIFVHLLTTTGLRICPEFCRCYYDSGRFTTDCSITPSSNRTHTYTDIPGNIHPATMVLRMDGNDLKRLSSKRLFLARGLGHLSELSLQNCSIEKISRAAFIGLIHMQTLSLRNNLLTRVESNVFSPILNLRTLDLSHNRISELESSAFVGAYELRTIDLSYNRLSYIFENTFAKQKHLRSIDLSQNRFSRIFPEVFHSLPNLQSLVLAKNPWSCDCYFRPFIRWERNKTISPPAVCKYPSANHGRLWDKLSLIEFGCEPRIVPERGEQTDAYYGDDVSLTCTAESEPKPRLTWCFTSKISPQRCEPLTPGANDAHYTIAESTPGTNLPGATSELTIINATFQDDGNYTCTATNIMKDVTTTFVLSLVSPPLDLNDGPDTRILSSQAVVVIVLIVLVLLLVLTIVVCCLVYYRKKAYAKLCAVKTNGRIDMRAGSPSSEGPLEHKSIFIDTNLTSSNTLLTASNPITINHASPDRSSFIDNHDWTRVNPEDLAILATSETQPGSADRPTRTGQSLCTSRTSNPQGATPRTNNVIFAPCPLSPDIMPLEGSDETAKLISVDHNPASKILVTSPCKVGPLRQSMVAPHPNGSYQSPHRLQDSVVYTHCTPPHLRHQSLPGRPNGMVTTGMGNAPEYRSQKLPNGSMKIPPEYAPLARVESANEVCGASAFLLKETTL